jgi:hypothetical protein
MLLRLQWHRFLSLTNPYQFWLWKYKTVSAYRIFIEFSNKHHICCKSIPYIVGIYYRRNACDDIGAPTGKILLLYKRSFTSIHTMPTTKYKPGKLAILVSAIFDNINAHYINWNICTFILMHKLATEVPACLVYTFYVMK